MAQVQQMRAALHCHDVSLQKISFWKRSKKQGVDKSLTLFNRESEVEQGQQWTLALQKRFMIYKRLFNLWSGGHNFGYKRA